MQRILPLAVNRLLNGTSATTDDPETITVIAEGARLAAPVVWLIGKVQSGKTSILRTITQSTDNEIGNGFKACTRTARVFDFPADAPILRFLDTRGLGETAYDPAEDLAVAESQAHLLLVTMRAMDLNQQAVIDVVSAVRRRHPNWPVVVAQTTLHEGYATGRAHPLPYPFADGELPERFIEPDLLRCLVQQRQLFIRVPGSAPLVFVPIDFTQSTDGYSPPDYGIDTLADALVRVAPSAMRSVLEVLPGLAEDGRSRVADPIIMGYAVAAAGSEFVPVAGAFAVSAVQLQLLRRLGQIYGVSFDRQTLAEFAGALGTGVAVRTIAGFGIRQIAKLIPVYGQTVAAATAAASSYAVTYAIGKAAIYFLGRRQRGQKSDGTARAYQQALREALRMAKDRTRADRPGAAPS